MYPATRPSVADCNAAYDHAAFQIDAGHVTRILYSGEKNATRAPEA